MKSINKRLLLQHIIINLTASSVLVLLMSYTGGFTKGVLSYVGLVLYTPGFLIVALLGGMNNAMHFTAYRTFLIVSFFLYATVIALLQVFLYKRRKKKKKSTSSGTTNM